MPDSSFGILGEPIENTQLRVRKAARALSRHGLAHAYGHVSARLDADSFLVCAAKPMGLIAPGEAGSVVPVSGPLPDGVLGEVRCHQQIYARRPDVNGICRFFPRKVMTLSTMKMTPKSRLGFGSYFHPAPPLWDDPLLLRSDEQAAMFAETLGEARAIVMRGNGAVTVGAGIEEAVVMAFYLEESAKTEIDVMGIRAAGQGLEALFSDEEAETRAVGTGMIYERMWEFMTAGDLES